MLRKKRKLKKKIVKIFDNLYDFSLNKVFKEKESSNNVLYEIFNNSGSDEEPLILEMNDLYHFPNHYKKMEKIDSIYVKNILENFREKIVKEFTDKINKKHNFTLEDFKRVNSIICIENEKFLNNIISLLFNFIEKNSLIDDVNFRGFSIIIENPHLTELKMSNIEILLKKLLEKFGILNTLDVKKENVENSSYFSIIRCFGKILDMIGDMDYKLNEKLNEDIKKKLEGLDEGLKAFPLLNFQIDYCLQSLIRLKEGAGYIKNLTTRVKKIITGAKGAFTFVRNRTANEAITAFDILKEGFDFDGKSNWYYKCREMELFIKTGKYAYLEAEVFREIKKIGKETSYNFLFYILLALFQEYDLIIDFLKIFKFTDKTNNRIKIYHNNIIQFISLIHNEIKRLQIQNSENLISLIRDFFMENSAKLKYLIEENKNLKNEYNQNEIKRKTLNIELAKDFLSFIEEKKFYETNDLENYNMKDNKSKSLIINKEYKNLFAEENSDYNLKLHYYRNSRLEGYLRNYEDLNSDLKEDILKYENGIEYIDMKK